MGFCCSKANKQPDFTDLSKVGQISKKDMDKYLKKVKKVQEKSMNMLK